MDQSWVHFVISRYSQSPKLSHRLFIRFVELMVSHHENHAIPIMVTPENLSSQAMPSALQVPVVPKSKAKSKALAKGQAKAMPLVPTHLPDADGEAEWELHSTTYHPGSMENPMTAPDPSLTAMQDRLLSMESALGQVIRHLENQQQILPVSSHLEMEEES